MDEEFVTKDGLHLKLRPISPFTLDCAARQMTFPPRPTYTIMSGTGIEEVHPHDEKSVQTPEERKALDDWLAEMVRLNREYEERSVKLFLMLGVEVAVPNDGWEEPHKFCGLEVPTEPMERKYFWLRNEALRYVADVNAVILRVKALSAPQEADVDAALAAFRRQVEREAAAGAAGAPGKVEPHGAVQRNKRRKNVRP